MPAPGAFRDATGVVLWHDDPARLCRTVLDGCPRLDWLHSLWTGLEHLPAGEIVARGITVTTGRGVPAGPLAEWALLSVLWHLKRVDDHRDRWSRGLWEPLEITELRGSGIAVAGLGTIGSAAARLFSGAGARVVGVRRHPRPVRGCATVEPMERLREVCQEVRALVVALPLTTETRGLVGRETLAALPDGGLVVNVGRGEVVDEAALLREVAGGRLAAALDVWWQEPPPAGSPWWRVANVLASPHSAYRTSAFRRRHADRVAENIGRYLEGRRLVAVTPRRELEGFARVASGGGRA